jgi:hypothetical protein
MDPTDKGAPYGHLPWFDQDRPVLVVDDEGRAHLRVTPRTPPERNRHEIHWDLTLSADGSAAGEGISLMAGAPAAELRDELVYASGDDRRRWLETTLAKESAGATLESFSIEGLDGTGDSLLIRYRFRAPRYAVRREGMLILRPGLHAASDLPEYVRPGIRVHPVRFKFGMDREVNLSLRLPAGWKAEPAAAVDSLGSPFGYSRTRWLQETNLLRVSTAYRLNGESVPPGRYIELQEFLDAMRERDLAEVILTRDATREATQAATVP